MEQPKTRYSKQRETIYDILMQDYTHPTVDTIYIEARKVIPDISLGTVYRNLNHLYENKRIQRIDIGDNAVHYDAHIDPHYHIVCQKCGRILDVDLDPSDVALIQKAASNQSHARIQNTGIIFYGTCEECLQSES